MTIKDTSKDINNPSSNNQYNDDNLTTVEAAFDTTNLLSEENTPTMEGLSEIEKEPISTLEKSVLEKENKIHITFEDLVNSIEQAFPKDKPLEFNVFPHPRNWLGPRFMAIWTIPILFIVKIRDFISASNPVTPYKPSENTITKAETIFTAIQNSKKGSSNLRFFGPVFLAIWVIPLAITGTAMEILFISPLKNINIFG